jgi:phosphoribosylformylglycinamidine synthase subunit PurSL
VARRVEVGFKHPQLDARGSATKEQINHDLGLAVERVRVLDVYYIDRPLDDEQTALVAEDLLTDPVLQTYALEGALPEDADWVIEVGYLPGVTDNVGRTAAEAIDLILGPNGRPDFVRTARVYAIDGRLTRQEAERICVGALANPLVHGFEVMPGPRYAGRGFAFPEPARDRPAKVNTVVLPGDDEGLMRLSREGLLSLTIEEMRAIRDHFGRPEIQAGRRLAGLPEHPTDVELETLAQTWSEHCKHKIFNCLISYSENGGQSELIDGLFSSYIRRATERVAQRIDWLVSVFRDNAGIISFNKSHNLVFKVETHNHPSALDPYGGALTGIVGVNRDPMGTGIGAELIFNTDVFCFGPPDFPPDRLPPGIHHPRRIFRGVRQGVEDGGNQIGIPTVNGAILFDEAYTYNPLVFCGTGGIMPKVVAGLPSHEKSIEPGDLIVMAGGRIGKDGIHGATFSSVKLEETTPPAVVQIGAPIVQKKLMDALIEARDLGLYRAITDNGAGGLSSSVGEMAEFSGGAEVDLDRAPLKYPGLEPWEMWVSESQERMTLAVPPENIERLLGLFESRDVEGTVIGRFTDDGHLSIRFDGRLVARLSLDWLHHGLPRMELNARWEDPQAPDETAAPETAPALPDAEAALLKILGGLNVCSKEAVIRRYDHEVQGSSVVKPLVGLMNDGPSDAAVLKPLPGAPEGVVVACGINPKYGLIDPRSMALSAVDEAVRNSVAVGADPRRIAILDNFCWGNPIRSPENPDGDLKLGQLVRAAKGCFEAAVELGAPYISGKDSFHNEYDLGDKTLAIPPTLLISAIGVIEDVDSAVTMDAKAAGDYVYALGLTKSEMGGSHYCDLTGRSGTVPGLDGPAAVKTYQALHQAISQGTVASCHDCSEGGLAVALAETAFAGGLGIEADLGNLSVAGDLSDVEALFSETNSRFVVTVKPSEAARFEAELKDVVWSRIGEVTASRRLICKGRGGGVVIDLEIDRLKKAWQQPLSWV